MAEKMQPKSKTKMDLIGQKFGRWTVLEEAEPYTNSKGYPDRRWRCVCDCGKEKIILERNLKNNRSQSCGCLLSEKNKKKSEDLLGRTFGAWTVIARSDNTKWGTRWVCECSCGNIKSILARHLLSGDSKSCGCLTKQYQSKTRKGKKLKCNEYDLDSQPYGIGYISKNHLPFYFDKEDYNLICNYYWNINSYGYICAKKNNKIILLSRLITNVKDNMVVDHINHITTDNRKSNLRIITSQMNAFNKKKLESNNSGCTGVYLDKKSNKWKAQIGFNYTVYYLGSYDSKEDAITARKIAEEKYFGEHSYETSMKIAEKIKIKDE